MAIEIVRPPESQSQSQRDELEDDDEYDEDTPPFRPPPSPPSPPSPPPASLARNATTTTTTTRKGGQSRKQRRARETNNSNNNNHGDDIPVPSPPTSHLDLEFDGYYHSITSTSAFPSHFNALPNLNGSTSNLPLNMHPGSRARVDSSDAYHHYSSQPLPISSSFSSSSSHPSNSQRNTVEHRPPAGSTVGEPSENQSTSTSSLSYKHDRVSGVRGQSQSNTGRMAPSTSQSQPAPNEKVRAASALSSRNRLALPSTQPHPGGPFVSASQVTHARRKGSTNQRNFTANDANVPSSSPDSETSDETSKDREEIQNILTRMTRHEPQPNELASTLKSKTRLTFTEIMDKESQRESLDDDFVQEEDSADILPSDTRRQSTQQVTSSSRNGKVLPSSQLSQGGPSKLVGDERRPTSRTIQSPPRQRQSNIANRPSNKALAKDSGAALKTSQRPQMNNSDTDDSDDGANRSGNDYGGGDDVGTENDATRVDHTIQQIPDSDADATRFEPLDTEGDAQSSDDDDDNNHLDMPRFTSRKEDNPGRIRSFNPDGTEILPKAMARRTGRKVIETKSGKSKTIGRAEFDGDGLGPPLSTLKSAELSRRNSTLSPIKSAGLKRSIRNSLTTPGSGPALRRSGRSSTDPAVRKITVGDTFPIRSYKKLFEAANSVIGENGGHVANITLSEMYLNDENDFEETQLAEDRLQEDPKAAVRTWQIFIYCRNRKLSVKVPNTRSPIRRDASSQSNGSATSHVNAGPSNATAQPAAEDSSPSSSPGSVQVTGNDTSFPPIQLPPDDIYRHPKEANCPAQISAFLQVDTRNLGRSLWKIDQVADRHCIECLEMDMVIGKGKEDQMQARQEYFSYWSEHWEKQVKAVLARTKNFTILPASKEGLGIALDYGAVQSEAEEIDQQAEDGRDELLELPPSLPSRKSNKRKPARKIFQVDDFEIDPPTFPDQPSSAKRPRFDAPTSKPARKTGVKAHPAASNGRTGKGKAPARIRTQTTSLHQIDEEEDYDLYPGTRLCELGLPKSINKLLTECSIITLEDLRNAIKGDTSFFDAGTDIPVEDFLSFMQTKLSQYATGSIGFQYDFNRMHESGRAETDDGNDNQQEDTRDHKNAFINNCFTILKAGRVLTRALRAVEWE